jgi:glutamate synthase (NADPH) large chain
VEHTASPLGKRILANWSENLRHFVRVLPHEYKRVLANKAAETAEELLAAPPAHAAAVGERLR